MINSTVLIKRNDIHTYALKLLDHLIVVIMPELRVKLKQLFLCLSHAGFLPYQSEHIQHTASQLLVSDLCPDLSAGFLIRIIIGVQQQAVRHIKYLFPTICHAVSYPFSVGIAAGRLFFKRLSSQNAQLNAQSSLGDFQIAVPLGKLFLFIVEADLQSLGFVSDGETAGGIEIRRIIY